MRKMEQWTSRLEGTYAVYVSGRALRRYGMENGIKLKNYQINFRKLKKKKLILEKVTKYDSRAN